MDIIDKIDNVLITPQQYKDVATLIELHVFMENYPNMMNEGFGDFFGKVEQLSKAMGVHVSSTGRGGLIGILYKSGVLMAEFIWNALRAATGDKQAAERVKELANTKIEKADVIDFLLRVDGVTLHTLTGPIHLIDNLTGWHIWAAIHDKIEDITVRAGKAIDALVDVVKDVDDEIKVKAKGLLHGIARVMGLDDQQKTINSRL